MSRRPVLGILLGAVAVAVTPAHASSFGDPPTADADLPERPADLDVLWLGHDAPDASEIVNGRATTEFPSVVALGIETGGGVGIFCSATLITDTWVLTAAHCVDALRDYERQGATGLVIFGTDLTTNKITHKSAILTATNHPEWTQNLDDGADIAVVEFTLAAVGVRPMPLLECDSDLRSPEVLDYVGFGITGDGRRDSGIKRTADIQFDEVRGDFLISYDPSKNLCSGDSGGAALRTTADGYALAGVNSFVFDAVGDGSSCFTGGSGATRVASFVDWIAQETDWLPVDPEGGHGSTGEEEEEEGEREELEPEIWTEEGPESEPELGPEPESEGGGSETPEGEPETGGPDPQDPGSGLGENPFGCACNASAAPGSLGVFALLGLIGLVRRRR